MLVTHLYNQKMIWSINAENVKTLSRIFLNTLCGFKGRIPAALMTLFFFFISKLKDSLATFSAGTSVQSSEYPAMQETLGSSALLVILLTVSVKGRLSVAVLCLLQYLCRYSQKFCCLQRSWIYTRVALNERNVQEKVQSKLLRYEMAVFNVKQLKVFRKNCLSGLR